MFRYTALGDDPFMRPNPVARFDEWQFTSQGSRQNAKLRVARVAERQFGRIRWDQLRALGISEAVICDWVARGYLHPVLPRVYAVGHVAGGVESDLAAALLYAGPGAMLSHGTAIWWWGLLHHPPPTVQLSTPRRCRSRPGVSVHGRRQPPRVTHRDLPVTTVPQALLDFAAQAPRGPLRLVLANADYHGWLDLGRLDALMGRGVNGSASLRQAIEVHRPELAHTRSELERRLLALCEKHCLPIPQVNVILHGWLVDAVWPERKLVVEVDGLHAHRTPAQLQRDHERDLALRRAGHTVLRYTWRQLNRTPEAVATDLRRFL